MLQNYRLQEPEISHVGCADVYCMFGLEDIKQLKCQWDDSWRDSNAMF